MCSRRNCMQYVGCATGIVCVAVVLFALTITHSEMETLRNSVLFAANFGVPPAATLDSIRAAAKALKDGEGQPGDFVINWSNSTTFFVVLVVLIFLMCAVHDDQREEVDRETGEP